MKKQPTNLDLLNDNLNQFVEIKRLKREYNYLFNITHTLWTFSQSVDGFEEEIQKANDAFERIMKKRSKK